MRRSLLRRTWRAHNELGQRASLWRFARRDDLSLGKRLTLAHGGGARDDLIRAARRGGARSRATTTSLSARGSRSLTASARGELVSA